MKFFILGTALISCFCTIFLFVRMSCERINHILLRNHHVNSYGNCKAAPRTAAHAKDVYSKSACGEMIRSKSGCGMSTCGISACGKGGYGMSTCGISACGKSGCSTGTHGMSACGKHNNYSKLQTASHSGNQLKLEYFINDKLLCFMLFAAIACLVSAIFSLTTLPLCVLVAYLLSRKAPKWLKKRQETERRTKCEAQLDVMADIVSMGVRAGLPFDTSLKLFTSRFQSPLASELNKAMVRWQSGLQTRSDSFEALALSLNSNMFKRFTKTTIHAIAQGAPLAKMLTHFSKDVREQRNSEIEKKVEKAPIKMFIPMGTCMLPAMLIFVMGPVLLQFVSSSV